MKQQKPILHGRDHSCGGADPIPGYCDLIALLDRPDCCGGGDHRSVQTSRFEYHPMGSPTDHWVTTWPQIVIPSSEHTPRRDAGYSLHVMYSCTVYQITNIRADPGTAPFFPTGAGPEFVSESGSTTVGTPGVDVVVTMTVQSLYGAVVDTIAWVDNGVLVLTWIDGPDFIPAPVGPPGRMYTGAYPILDSDVSDDANIDPVKLAHPGGQTTFLRGDGTFAAAAFQVEF